MFDEQEHLGVAHALTIPWTEFLPDNEKVTSWKPLFFELRDGDFPDYLASNLAYRMCSERLRRILDKHASTSDVLQWLDVTVKSANANRDYFILRFPQPPDVLDKGRSTFAADFVFKAVLSKDRIGDHQVFAYPQCGKLPFFISAGVKHAIEREHFTGMDIALASVA